MLMQRFSSRWNFRLIQNVDAFTLHENFIQIRETFYWNVKFSSFDV